MSAESPASGRPLLVVGGAGFLGSHLVDGLLDEGHAVDVVDDLSGGSLTNLADARRRGAPLKIHNFDIRSADGLAVIAMRRPSTVYHLALLAGVRHPGTPSAAAAAFASVLEVLEAARLAGVDRVVVALPAAAICGRPSGRELPVKEVDPPQPRGLRGVAAAAVVGALVDHRDTHGVEFTALAMSTVYGPRQRPDAGVVARFAAAAARGQAPTFEGDGRQTRDLMYVEDAVDALLRAELKAGGLVVNVGTGVQTSLRDLWDAIAPDGPPAQSGRPRPDELARFAVSPVRARIHLAWSPWTTLEDGLTETLAAFRSSD